MTEPAVRVLVSGHARRRALERATIGVTLVAREVSEAVEAGRMSVHEPAWTNGDGRRADRTKAGDRHGKRRWVWPPEETRAYLIRRTRGLCVVVTCVTAAVPAGELAA